MLITTPILLQYSTHVSKDYRYARSAVLCLHTVVAHACSGPHSLPVGSATDPRSDPSSRVTKSDGLEATQTLFCPLSRHQVS